MSPRIVTTGLLVYAALLRVAYALGYAGLPFANGPIGDSPVYLRQAAAVEAGRHGDAALLAMSPLPGYFLALFGARSWWVIGAQLAIGVGVAGLLAWTTRRAFGAGAAVGATALYVGYGVFPFYETKLLGETLGFACALGALALVLEAPRRRQGWAVALAAGAVMACAVLFRASLLFAAALVPLFALAPVRRDDPLRPRLARAGGALLGLGAVFTLRGLVTLAHAGTFVAVLYTAPELEGTRELRPAREVGAASVVGQRSTPEGPLRSAWEMVDAVDARLARGEAAPPLLDTAGAIDVGALLARAPEKLAATFAAVEATYQYAYYGERAQIPALNLHPVSVPFVALLALFGVVALTLRGEARSLAPFAPLVLGTLATTALYMPIAGYRLPMLAALLPLAGVGLAALAQGVRAWNRWALAGTVVALLVFFPTALRNLRYDTRHPERWHLVLAESYAAQSPPDRAHVESELAAALTELRARGQRPSPAFLSRAAAIRAVAAPR